MTKLAPHFVNVIEGTQSMSSRTNGPAPAFDSPQPDSTASGLGKWLPLLVLCLAQLSTSGDNATLSIATGALIKDLNAPMDLVSIANAMYSLAAGSLMVAAGMVGLIVGWKKTFRVGCALLFCAEITAFFSPNMEVFTYGARLLSGIGGSFMIPSVLGLIASNYRGREQAVAFGAIGAASGVSFAAGPIICGLLVDHLGWRYAFGAIACLCVVIFLGSFIVPTPPKPARKVVFDLPGVLLTVIGLFSVILGFLKVSSWGLFTPFSPPFTVLGLSPAPFLVLFGIVVLALMLKWERHREATTGSALIPMSFIGTPQVRNGLYLTAFIFLAYGSGIFVTVSFVQVVAGLTAIQTGLMILPFALGVVVFSLGLPVIYKNANPKRMCQAALVIGAVGSIACILGFDLSSYSAVVPFGMCLIGISMGIISAYSSYCVTSALPPRDAQQSGGVQATSRNVGDRRCGLRDGHADRNHHERAKHRARRRTAKRCHSRQGVGDCSDSLSQRRQVLRADARPWYRPGRHAGPHRCLACPPGRHPRRHDRDRADDVAVPVRDAQPSDLDTGHARQGRRPARKTGGHHAKRLI
jgi:MFS family permease